jgi:threonine/homoserine/homoserine lactone efflux protein
MFIIFILGPCEPMIPLLYFPAAKNSWAGMIILIAVYTLITLLTMVTMVILGYMGIAFVKTEKLGRYVHALGGLTIFICGAGMLFLGW